jgi:S1-C subfamily serine protease
MKERFAPLATVDEPDVTASDGAAPSDPPSTFWRRKRFAWGLGVLCVVVLLAVAVLRFSGGGPAPLTRADVNRAVQSGISQDREQQRLSPPDAGTAYRRIFPSLVTVLDSKASSEAGSTSAGKGALGAGVVIDAQGAILTALHVVSGGGTIQVRFADGTQSVARVVQSQPASDIAVLGVDRLPSVVVPAVMGGAVQVGDAVFPVGNPLGLQGSLTAGVVSALQRTIRAEGNRTLKGLIQFDAAVNPGNSGGPLLDRDGHVVGIVTGLANPSQQPFFVGIGFAVPIATAGGVAGGPSK